MQDIEDIVLDSKDNLFDENTWTIICDEFTINSKNIKSNKDLQAFYLHMQRTYKLILSKSTLLKAYYSLGINNDNLKTILIKKRNKSTSGVVVITVLTSAHPEYIDKNGDLQKAKFSCAWDCHYCPNEKASENNNYIDQPRSYLFQEPAVLRANQNNFDAILQFNARVNTLINMGHTVDKVELLILGGTWCSYPKAYQKQFITELYYAANVFYDVNKRHIGSLDFEITANENSRVHIIGLTLETRPDTISLDEIKMFRKYNATRIQLGVQHTNNNVLKTINRGHDIECVYTAIKMLKDNGYKVDIHLMPNLPSSSYEMDVEMLNAILYDDRLQADQLKIYPCAVVPFTKIKKWYEDGSYVPYDDLQLFNLIKNFKQKVQPYKRLNRIIRDIPSSYISGGYTDKSVNMRQLLQDDMKKNNWKCSCIRCREIKDKSINIDDVQLKKLFYRASNGDEYFISYETDEYLIGFIRLRINTLPDDNLLPILQDAALIRELHVYSTVICVGNQNNLSMQHKGIGKQLIKEAEKIAKQNNLNKIAIISGTGVRNYYRKLGYILEDTYMIKYFPNPICTLV
jgi:ELP3 family radical SAM enzyme/protein acetyltransferase